MIINLPGGYSNTDWDETTRRNAKTLYTPTRTHIYKLYGYMDIRKRKISRWVLERGVKLASYDNTKTEHNIALDHASKTCNQPNKALCVWSARVWNSRSNKNQTCSKMEHLKLRIATDQKQQNTETRMRIVPKIDLVLIHLSLLFRPGPLLVHGKP